jgi:phage gp29-like protein
MAIEIAKLSTSGDADSHLAMVRWAEGAMSKVILGQRGDEAQSGGIGSGQADFQREVRRDIRNADARQVAATLTRDLVYPLLALNRGVDSLRRCPRFQFDTGEPEDLSTYAQALPGLVGVGLKIPVAWAHERLRIPLPEGDEAVLGAPAPVPAPGGEPATAAAPGGQPAGAALAALATTPPAPAPASDPTPVSILADRLQTEAAGAWQGVLDHVARLVSEAESLPALQATLLAAYDGLPLETLRTVMASGFAVARLAGLSDVLDESRS